jgi:hypothetical protein
MTTIEAGKHWREFSSNFSNKYFQHIANARLRGLASFSKEDLFQCPNIMLYGTDTTLLKLYTDAILSSIFKRPVTKKSATYDVSSNNNKYNCPYKYSDVHIEVDMEHVPNPEKQYICEFISKHVAQTKNINQPKHIVVIHNMNMVSAQVMNSLKKPTDSNTNVLFILTSSRISNIDYAIKSRCLHVRCNTEYDDLETFLETFVEGQNIPDQVEVDPDDGLVKILMKLGLSERTCESTLSKNVREFITDLFKEKSLPSACEKIRTFAHKILHFNFPVARIFQECIQLFVKDKRLENHMFAIAELSADLELKSRQMSKPVIILEHYWTQIYAMVNAYI